jgi:hypothetical protein
VSRNRDIEAVGYVARECQIRSAGIDEDELTLPKQSSQYFPELVFAITLFGDADLNRSRRWRNQHRTTVDTLAEPARSKVP